MPDFYERVSAEPVGVDPDEAKAYLRVEHEADDDAIRVMLEAATFHAEKRTGRDMRAVTWRLLRDDFDDRICLRRSPVASISSVERLVSAAFVAVATSVYYLKRGPQFSEILLNDGEEWPDDADEREQVVRVDFLTAEPKCFDEAKVGILRLLAGLYENRGDCDPQSPSDVAALAASSGADSLLDHFAIARV